MTYIMLMSVIAKEWSMAPHANFPVMPSASILKSFQFIFPSKRTAFFAIKSHTWDDLLRIKLISLPINSDCLHLVYFLTDEGIDTRIHGLKIASTREAEMGLSLDTFGHKDKMFRYPALEHYSKKVVYRRAQVLQR